MDLRHSNLRACLATAVLSFVAVLAFATSPASAGVVNAGLARAGTNDPLTGLGWGNYSGPMDEIFPSFRTTYGFAHQLVGRVALTPRMRWFGGWNPDDQAQAIASQYIANASGGNPNVMVQMAIFRMKPWEQAACQSLPTAAEQASYKTWIDNFAAGIGDARVALVLQPDLPFASCVPHHSMLPLRMVTYAARVFGALPRTSVSIDAGAGDWPSVGQAAWLLRNAGVRYARGFALNATHYDATENEIRFGARVAQALAAGGFPGKHFVINTSTNGRGFTYQQYNDPATFDNARVCASRNDRRCATLGIPPTTDVANPRWGLSPRARRLAKRYVDAYLWIGRPWLDNQDAPFDLQRTIRLAATTPF